MSLIFFENEARAVGRNGGRAKKWGGPLFEAGPIYYYNSDVAAIVTLRQGGVGKIFTDTYAIMPPLAPPGDRPTTASV